METFFPTSTLPSADVPNDRDDLIIQIENLRKDNERLQMNFDAARSRNEDLIRQINNVRGYVHDLYSMNGDIADDVKEIAELLDIEMTKSISGTATFEISFTAQVPLDFDPSDFELSLDVSCDSYEADDFEWNEENTDIDCEDAF
jgi:hypothetical protein